jgi:hypothetical protein
MRPSGFLAVFLSLLAACTTPAPDKVAPATTRERFGEAATTPLRDLNIVRAEIPAILAAAVRAPYALPTAGDCAALAGEIAQLDAALGADLDAPPAADDPGLIVRGTEAVTRLATGAVRSATAGVIPHRRWVRELTGAERYSREVGAAITAGTIRRGFLKGVGLTMACPAAMPRV